MSVYQWIMYGLFFALLGVSLTVYIVELFGGIPGLWQAYNQIYIQIALLHTWIIMVLLLITDLRQKKFPLFSNRIAVIVPCFNEPIDLLERSLRSISGALGEKEIILVDDGSTNGTKEAMRTLAKKFGATFHSFNRNRGKRHALHIAVTTLIKNSRFVVMVDSDTVLDPEALLRLTAPLLYDARIGATSGDVRLLNENDNPLTKMIAAYYWIALHIHRRAQSALGMVGCCSGALSGHRMDILPLVMDDFLHQEFLGEECNHSEDRHLTNLILRLGFDVAFVPEAICYTHTPSTLKRFLCQQQRWRRGFLQESIFTLSYAWRKRPALFLEVLIWDIAMPFLSVGIMIAMFVSILTHPFYFLFTLLPSWLILLFIRSLPLIFQAREKFPGLFFFMIFSTFVLYWQMFIALCTLRNTKWITR